MGASLRRLGEAAEEEHITADGHSLDYALVDERIAIEVDGPWHFALSGDGAGRRPVGKTLLKRRQLAALGWRLLEVPWWEWDPLGHGEGGKRNHVENDSEAQCEYLRLKASYRGLSAADPDEPEEPLGHGEGAETNHESGDFEALCEYLREGLQRLRSN